MTYEQKQCILKYFGCYALSIDGIWGPASAEGTKQLQRRCGLPADGVFGTGTEEKVRQLIGAGAVELPGDDEPVKVLRGDWWDEIEYFSPDEFMCQCYKYTRYCDGWPHEMQELTVRICDRARKHFGKPITIISGLRCEQHNKAVDGVWNSQHMYGEATDLYVWGVNPETVLAWFRSQSDVRYAYRIAGSNNIHFDIEKVGR